jgi:hypothetical protein
MGDEKPKTGKYRLGSAILWALAQGIVAKFVMKDNTWNSVSAAVAGLAAGWTTAAVLGALAKWGSGAKVLAIAGLIVGVLVASGAVAGLRAIVSWHLKAPQINWDELQRYILSEAAIPAAVLGLVTGLYVRSAIPQPKKP